MYVKIVVNTLFHLQRKIHYIVIGGWLPQLLDSNESLARNLRKFDGIYVETNTMKMTLESKGFQNIILMPNCKELVTLSADELIYQEEIPFKLCTFSRVMKEKGIEDVSLYSKLDFIIILLLFRFLYYHLQYILLSLVYISRLHY